MLIEKSLVARTGNEAAGEIAKDALDRTAHLIKARSVAVGAAQCIFTARLVEVFGSSMFLSSVIPGKGHVAHQILALAFPPYVLENVEDILAGKPVDSKPYVDDSENSLVAEAVLLDSNPSLLVSAISEADKLMTRAARELPTMCERVGLDLRASRVLSELQLLSYKVHIWGILDSLIEDKDNKKAIILDWKTGRLSDEKPLQISNPDLAQVCAYALLEADRLGFDDLMLPIMNGSILPAIVRSKGNIPVYSISPKYKTCKRSARLYEYLNNVVLASEHLTLLLSDVDRLLGAKVERYCQFDTGDGRTHNALRYSPFELPRGNPRNGKYPCTLCNLQEECEEYIGYYEKKTEIDMLAERSRHAIYDIRENALKPYRDLNDKSRFVGSFCGSPGQPDVVQIEGGNRLDVFSEVEVGYNAVVVRRSVREKEVSQERISSVRAGKPVALFFSEPHVPNSMMAVNFVGRVDDVDIEEDDKVAVRVGAPSIPSRLNPLLIRMYLDRWPDLATRVIALETNVDLTHHELTAVDAFQRGTKRKIAMTPASEEEVARAKSLEGLLFGYSPGAGKGAE